MSQKEHYLMVSTPLCAGSLIQNPAFQVDNGSVNLTPALHKSPRVTSISIKSANELLDQFHYLGGLRTSTCCFGHSEGVTVWGVLRSASLDRRLKSSGFKPLECVRMVGIPSHKWAMSSLLSHSIHLIFKHGFADCLVTYADRMQGHTGNVYLASNWRRMDQDAQPDGFEWRLDGKIVSRKRFYAELGTSKIESVKAKYGDRITLTPDVPKIRFVYLKDWSRKPEFDLAARKVKTWGAKRVAAL